MQRIKVLPVIREERSVDLTAKGKEELAEVMGLKKYLEDFSLISEREISETIIWQDYMVYATLFGIADKVIKQFEKVYPDRVPEFENYNRNVYYSTQLLSQHAQICREGNAGRENQWSGRFCVDRRRRRLFRWRYWRRFKVTAYSHHERIPFRKLVMRLDVIDFITIIKNNHKKGEYSNEKF